MSEFKTLHRKKCLIIFRQAERFKTLFPKQKYVRYVDQASRPNYRIVILQHPNSRKTKNK